jgi:site-specific DNA-cytosine methylase
LKVKTAVEFFSGIGAFAEAPQSHDLEIVAAFDQCAEANQTYQKNFGLEPNSRNLDSLRQAEIPQADIWWMSPPCKPFTVRGKKRDDEDPRAASFLKLISLIPRHLPDYIFVENVLGFRNSRVHSKLTETLKNEGYSVSRHEICPTELGIPMKRPRIFVLACQNRPIKIQSPDHGRLSEMASVKSFLRESEHNHELLVDQSDLERYGPSLNILDPHEQDAVAICFTSNYWKSMKASGSLLKLPDQRARRFAPEEILRLLGFGPGFSFPETLDMRTRWRLAGNSVDVRSIRSLLDLGFAPLELIE